MSPRQVLLSAAMLLALLGAIFGLQPRSVDTQYGTSTECGFLFKPAAVPGDPSSAAECDDRIDGLKIPAYGSLGLAGLSFIAAFVASPKVMRRPSET